MTWTRYGSRAYGRAVSIYADDSVRIGDDLPFWWREEEVDGEQHVAIHPGDDVASVVHQLEFWVAEHATEAVFVHAGVVAVEGAALLLPGRSHTGKSSLVAALLRAGAAYGSDEFAVITPGGLVHAYPRKLMIRTAEGVHRIEAREFGADAVMAPARIRAVADLRYEAGAAWSVAPLTTSAALMHLLDNAVAARRRPREVLDALTAAMGPAHGSLRGVRGDADEAAALLLEAVR